MICSAVCFLLAIFTPLSFRPRTNITPGPVLGGQVKTNGKLERYHQTIKRDVKQVPYEMASDLEAALAAFAAYYNYRRYHKALGNPRFPT